MDRYTICMFCDEEDRPRVVGKDKPFPGWWIVREDHGSGICKKCKARVVEILERENRKLSLVRS